jgi:transposase
MPKYKEFINRNNPNDIDERTRRSVLKYYKRLKTEKRYNERGELIDRPKMTLLKEVCDTFNISLSSFYRIKSSKAIPTSKVRKNTIYYTYCDNDFELIDNIIIDLNKQNKCVFIKDVFNYMKSDSNCEISFKDCELNTFYKLMHKMKYKYQYSRKIIRQQLINTQRIQNMIKDYLIEKLRLEKLYCPPKTVFVDETHAHKNDVPNKTLQPIDQNKQIKMNKTIGKRQRFSIINAGDEDGFIPNAALVVYKKELNAEEFEDYLKFKLMPQLPEHSVVIYDNCSIHSRRYNRTPNTNTNKETIKNWLINNNIEFDDNLTKAQLLEIVKTNPRNPNYYADDIVRSFNCHPLRTPPYVCDLNPIENIWNTWKKLVQRLNYNNNLEQFKNLLYDCFEQINSTIWGNTVRNVV